MSRQRNRHYILVKEQKLLKMTGARYQHSLAPSKDRVRKRRIQQLRQKQLRELF